MYVIGGAYDLSLVHKAQSAINHVQEQCSHYHILSLLFISYYYTAILQDKDEVWAYSSSAESQGSLTTHRSIKKMVFIENTLIPLYLSLIHHPLMSIETFLSTQLNVGLNYSCYLPLVSGKAYFFLSPGKSIPYLLLNYGVCIFSKLLLEGHNCFVGISMKTT